MILDEPDVYLHADLQRKLIRLLANRFTQVIIATHSVEIMSEVDPESILIIDKTAPKSKFATSIPAAQKVIDGIGAVHNLQLARLWAARRCIFIEGDDLEFLHVVSRALFPESDQSLLEIPVISIGGLGNWSHAIGATMGLKNAGDEAIETYCILDSDFRPIEKHEEIRQKAAQHGLHLHIWTKKEIESYFLIPSAIGRFIANKSRKAKPRIETIEKKLNEICDALRDKTIDAISTEIHVANRGTAVASSNARARQIVRDNWNSLEEKLSIVSAKDVFSQLSDWSKKNYGVSFSAVSIARKADISEMSNEITGIVSAIHNLEAFPS